MKNPVWKRASALFCALVAVLSLTAPRALAQEAVPEDMEQQDLEQQVTDQVVELSIFDEGEHSYLPPQSFRTVRILLEGEELIGGVPAFLKEGRTLFPIRLVFEALGATVEWVDETRQAIVSWEGRQMTFTLGSPVVLVDGEEQMLPDGVGPCLVLAMGEVRTMVPLRFLAEWLGFQVQWEDATRTVYLTANGGELPNDPAQPEGSGELDRPEPADPVEGPGDLEQTEQVEPTEVPEGGVKRPEQIEPEEPTEGPEEAEAEPPDQPEQTDPAEEPQEPEEDEQVVLPLTGYYVAIDAGHGGHSPGAVYEGIQEKDIDLPIALRVAELLRERGCQVFLTREDDQFVDIYDRSYMANDAGVDIFVSIHANASGVKRDFQGTFTYYFPGSQEGKELAQALQDEVVKSAGSVDRGLLTDNFVVLRETNMPAALVETGFMSSHEELMRLIDPEYQEKLAQGIARGIEVYLTAEQE